MNILQFSIFKNTKCAGGCKFCGLSVDSSSNRKTGPILEEDLQKAFSRARQDGARLEVVFPTVGANPKEVSSFLQRMQGVIQENSDVEIAINPGICTKSAFYENLLRLGVGRYRNNLETSTRLFAELVPNRPGAQKDKLRSLEMARSAGLSVDTGWLCGLGEQKEDIQDLIEMLKSCAPDSITINYFDYRESAEKIDFDRPDKRTAISRFKTLRSSFPNTEITLGGAYMLWLGHDFKDSVSAEGCYVGQFLDHGKKDKSKSSQRLNIV